MSEPVVDGGAATARLGDPAPGGVEGAAGTGDPLVDAALDRLGAMPPGDLDGQVRVLAEVHEALQQRLSSPQR